jgi:hypothetical protein
MLRQDFVVEVQHKRISVRMTGTSYLVAFVMSANSPQLVPTKIPFDDDHRAAMDRTEFLGFAKHLAEKKARQLGWIT